ncbi:hypothetical protein LTR84_003681 [Exophiala bonariae]|uniref:DUF7791 domain-containing protein n=1 Tax=Exophiala bonariae TaxID=1690606 RepID=A0AAV9N8Q6_9EURO|nr:hypothetical protein LTR84_003681 [Exophiala bonariae]
MVQLFRSWTANSHVKILVSSRPWNIYEDLFSTPQLRLEDLTALDIQEFVCHPLYNSNSLFRRNLEQDDLETSKTLIFEKILERAEGVFLWVRLVANSLIQISRDGATLDELVDELQNMPDDLDDFFLRMMNAIHPRYQREASIIMQIALADFEPIIDTTWYKSSITNTLLLSDLSYLAIKDSPYLCLKSSFQPLKYEKAKYLHHKLKRRLVGRCMGLLEVAGRLDIWGAKIVFLHRTVRDFLLSAPAKEILLKSAGGVPYDAHAFRCNAALANMLTIQDEFPEDKFPGLSKIFCQHILNQRPGEDKYAFELYIKFS